MTALVIGAAGIDAHADGRGSVEGLKVQVSSQLGRSWGGVERFRIIFMTDSPKQLIAIYAMIQIFWGIISNCTGSMHMSLLAPRRGAATDFRNRGVQALEWMRRTRGRHALWRP